MLEALSLWLLVTLSGSVAGTLALARRDARRRARS